MGAPVFEGVFFDLDGTLADTAPDLVAAANRLLIANQRTPMAYEILRPMASAGARGLIQKSFGIGPDHPEFITFLATQTIDKKEWEDLKTNKPEIALQEIDVFSDLIWDKAS